MTSPPTPLQPLSVIPDALDALTDLWDQVDGLQVGQGTLLNQQKDFLIVGYDASENQPAVTGSRATSNYGGEQDNEVFDVTCLLSVWIGDADVSRARARLFAYLQQLDTLLAGDRKLGLQRVLRAQLTEFSLSQPVTGNGSVANWLFMVNVNSMRA